MGGFHTRGIPEIACLFHGKDEQKDDLGVHTPILGTPHILLSIYDMILHDTIYYYMYIICISPL